MNIYGKIRFKDAIIIDEKLLRDLENTISQFFGKVSYSCRLCNDNRIEFESLDELINFENVKIRKIVSLSMKFNCINEIEFEPDISFFSSYKYTVQGTFNTDDLDKSVLFQEKVKAILDRNKQDRWYIILTKMNYMHLCLASFIFSTCSTIYAIYTGGLEQKISYNPLIFNLSISIGVVFFILAVILSKFRNVLLPPVAFKIGEQIKEIEKGRNLFSKIFWGVIVAFIVSLVVAYIA